MDTDAHADPLATLFRSTYKNRFAELDWPTWDRGVFDSKMQASADGQELSFVAGNIYTRRVLSLERPKKLSELLDKDTLNFLGRWGISGFRTTHQEVLEQVQGNQELLASFQSGVLYAINNLRTAEVPEGINRDVLMELLDVMEADGHDQFVSMAEIGADIAEKQRIEEMLERFKNCKTDDGEDEGSEASTVVAAENGEDHEDEREGQQKEGGDGEDKGREAEHVVLLFGSDVKGDDNEEDGSDQMKDLLLNKNLKDAEIDDDAQTHITVWTARRGKRVRSQKWIDAQKAKRKAKREQKRAEEAKATT